MEDYAPLIATKGSVAYDLSATETRIIPTLGTEVFNTVVKGPLSKDHSAFGLVCSRSGLAAKHSVYVLNAPGVIDADYEGVVQVILHNNNYEPYTVNEGDRIAQLLVFRKDSLALPEVVDKAERGEEGLGSTGK